MYCTRAVSDAVTWVGGNDRRLSLFENLFPIPRGVTYNSYLILDEKPRLSTRWMPPSRASFWKTSMHTLAGRHLDYLVVNHMEPDHCANIEELLLRFPELKVVGNAKTFTLMRQFYDFDLEGRIITVVETNTLSLGAHTLRFVFTPMVHWPEVMMTYEEHEHILFSADAFGVRALNGHLFDDEIDFECGWMADTRRYYGNIVGKYGPQVQAALNKLSGVEIAWCARCTGPFGAPGWTGCWTNTGIGAPIHRRNAPWPYSTVPCTAIRKMPEISLPPAWRRPV